MNHRFHVVLFLLVSIFSREIHAQHFEWAASGSNILSGYKTSCITSEGRLIAAGQYETPSYQLSSDPVALFDGAGNEHKFDRYSNQLFVASFDASGLIEWTFNGTDLGEGTHLLGIAPLSDGRVVIAFRAYSLQLQPISIYDAYDQDGQQNVKDEDGDDYFQQGNRRNWDGFDFFAVLSDKGELRGVHAMRFKIRDDWNTFKSCPDAGFVFTMADAEKVDIGGGKMSDRAHLYITKITRDFKLEWTYKLRYLDNSCCTYHQFPVIADVAQNGHIYFAGNFRLGIRPEQGKDHMAAIIEPISTYNEPYESVIGALSPEGKLKWVTYSGGKSLISDIHAANNQLIVSGKIQLQNNLFGMKIDTSEQKKAFLATFNYSGKGLWVETFNGTSVNAISSDESGNIFASFESKRSRGAVPLKIGSDTISDTFVRVVVASFDENGKYRWYKMSRAMMSNEPNTKLHADACGNLYITGEMWYVLPANMSLFDGAIVRGRGYGGAPLAARIRTTIPDNLLALNVSLQQSISITSREKQNKPVSNPPKGKIRAATSQVKQSANDFIVEDTLKSGRGLFCVPIPYPWKLSVFPNPSKGPITLRASISYTDDHVSCELWSAKGDFIRLLQSAHMREVGSFDLNVDLSDVAAGLYLIVLKGSGSAVTERVVISK